MLTQERLKELLHYDPETGVFTWRETRGSRAPKGARAGSIAGKGYWTVEIDGRTHRQNRLAWLYMTGAWPTGFVDHENQDKGDNSWLNLRDLTPKQNTENRGPSKFESGVVGVTRRGNRWLARIRHHQQLIRLGSYEDIADAIHVRQAAERLLFTHSPLCQPQS